MKPVWAARTGQASDAFLAYSETVQEDLPYLVHDLCGSIAHVQGLHHVGLLNDAEAVALTEGLQDVYAQFQAGTMSLDPALEDVHMNIEAKLTEPLGDVGKKLHTGRSRNDQVATCITLHAREGLVELAQGTQALTHALTEQASAHASAPWVARTHGQPAQPATLGFLLAAHAFRFQGLTQKILQAFDAVGTSPLGSGAVAGSTLPLEPAYTASLLGLAPASNALLATGSRDVTIQVVQLAGEVGLLLSSLAQDLLDLFTDGHLTLPDGFTTGSSLMPQKRNPDALELVRGKGKALAGLPSQAVQLVAGLGLGYMRDLQAIKPVQTQALAEALAALEILHACVADAQFHVTSDVLDAPGITATDVAEALVAQGMPFRVAYEHVAQAYQAVEQGATAPEALSDLGLPPEALEAALAALHPDPARRSTLGGPAPVQVVVQVAALQQSFAEQQIVIDQALQAIATPRALLEAA